MADAATPQLVATHLLEAHGGVDIVVHNAGVTRDRTLGRMDEAAWDQALTINLAAVAATTEALLRRKVLRDGGRVVCLSSIAGIAGNVGQTNYAASKAGIIGLVRHLGASLAGRGIAVNAVAPGFIETRMTAAVPLFIREAGRRLSSLGQGGLPVDVAEVITFLSSPGAAALSGSVIRVCGGGFIGA
jgi:3-oxoacyl-[acyl-carrier protein] reductase